MAQSDTKTNSAKKRAAGTKKRTVKKVSANKTKKTTAQSAAKTASVKTTTKRTAPSSFSEKLSTREAIKKNTTVVPKHIPTGNDSQLALLSPYRLPLPVDTIAIQTARLSGVLFVVLGAFFSLFHTQYLTADASLANLTFGAQNVASLCDPTDAACITDESNTTASVDTASGCLLDDQACLDAFYKPPAPNITVTLSGGSPVSGVVPVTITAAGAQDVIVYTYNANSQAETRLGAAIEQTTDTWHIDWDTTRDSDGRFKLRAFVKTDTGNYEGYSAYVEVENTPVDSTDSGDTSDTSTEDSTTATDIQVHIANLSLAAPEPITGLVKISADITDAKKVVVKARNRTLDKVYTLGEAYQEAATVWKFVFDTSQYPDGEYRVTFQAYSASGDTDTESITFDVHQSNNNTETTTDDSVVADGTTQISDASDDTVLDSNKLDPQVKVAIADSSPLSGSVHIKIDAESIAFAELYAKSKFSGTARFLGLAKKVDSNRWVYTWDTNNTPNGEYYVYAQVRNDYGVYQSNMEPVAIFNKTVTDLTVSKETELEKVYSEQDTKVTDYTNELLSAPKTEPAQTTDLNELTTEGTDEESATSTATASEADREDDYRALQQQLDEEFKRLAAALRTNDADAIAASRNRIQEATEAYATDEAFQSILTTTIDRITDDVAKTNRLITERTGVAAAQDTDQDGIADYDELNLFNTDPTMADTDGDGYTDGAEILNGFDPTDEAPETLVVFESPKETGVVREDILRVESITPVAQEVGDTDGVVAEAIISGTALPNSFITLYIFSTPIIVTVKTDEDGSWRYRFDKELEDGQHEVYVGVTDNAGRIVAKSEPLLFIKEAEAFTPVSAAAGATTVADNTAASLLSEYWIYLVLSISVVAIGLVLILLGLHLDMRKKEYALTEVNTAKPQPLTSV